MSRTLAEMTPIWKTLRVADVPNPNYERTINPSRDQAKLALL
jgi:hypothetical protein